jgi:hypothetical protein
LDGVYVRQDDGTLRFRKASVPTQEQLETLVALTARRGRALTGSADADEAPAIVAPTLKVMGLPADETPAAVKVLTAEADGFNLHAATCFEARERDAIERRGEPQPVPQCIMVQSSDGRVALSRASRWDASSMVQCCANPTSALPTRHDRRWTRTSVAVFVVLVSCGGPPPEPSFEIDVIAPGLVVTGPSEVVMGTSQLFGLPATILHVPLRTFLQAQITVSYADAGGVTRSVVFTPGSLPFFPNAAKVPRVLALEVGGSPPSVDIYTIEYTDGSTVETIP